MVAGWCVVIYGEWEERKSYAIVINAMPQPIWFQNMSENYTKFKMYDLACHVTVTLGVSFLKSNLFLVECIMVVGLAEQTMCICGLKVFFCGGESTLMWNGCCSTEYLTFNRKKWGYHSNKHKVIIFFMVKLFRKIVIIIFIWFLSTQYYFQVHAYREAKIFAWVENKSVFVSLAFKTKRWHREGLIRVELLNLQLCWTSVACVF